MKSSRKKTKGFLADMALSKMKRVEMIAKDAVKRVDRKIKRCK